MTISGGGLRFACLCCGDGVVQTHGGDVESPGRGGRSANPHFNHTGGYECQRETLSGRKASGLQPFAAAPLGRPFRAW